MEPLKSLIERAWEGLTEGWRELLARSSGALTHFRTEGARTAESPEQFPHWSLLAAETWVDLRSRGVPASCATAYGLDADPGCRPAPPCCLGGRRRPCRSQALEISRTDS